MRWTDLPAAVQARPLAQWRDTLAALSDVETALLDAALAGRIAGAVRGPLVVVDEGARATALAHVTASRLERGGLLVGVPVCASAADGRIAAVHVVAAVPGVDDEATPLSLRLDATVWGRARSAMRDGEAVVGWYHSHPGIGAFFSDTDRRTQAGFFRHAFSLGWVIDPVARQHAWFAGAQAEAVPPAAVLWRGLPAVHG